MFVTAAVVLATVPARAERLPLAHYTTAHGLPSNELSVVIEDDRGFLWIGSYRGLSRFDGRGFRNFGKEHGLDKSTTCRLFQPCSWIARATSGSLHTICTAEACMVGGGESKRQAPHDRDSRPFRSWRIPLAESSSRLFEACGG